MQVFVIYNSKSQNASRNNAKKMYANKTMQHFGISKGHLFICKQDAKVHTAHIIKAPDQTLDNM